MLYELAMFITKVPLCYLNKLRLHCSVVIIVDAHMDANVLIRSINNSSFVYGYMLIILLRAR